MITFLILVAIVLLLLITALALLIWRMDNSSNNPANNQQRQFASFTVSSLPTESVLSNPIEESTVTPNIDTTELMPISSPIIPVVASTPIPATPIVLGVPSERRRDRTRVRKAVVSTPIDNWSPVTPLSEELILNVKTPTEQAVVTDACSHSQATINVLSNGELRCSGPDVSARPTTSIRVERLVVYRGYLFSLSNEQLYQLTSALVAPRWNWQIVDWAPSSLTSLSTTLDGQCLWLQSNQHGWLYENGTLIEEVSLAPSIRRQYGNTKQEYLELDTSTHQLKSYRNGAVIETLNNIKDAVLDHQQHIHTVEVNSNRRGVRLINWKPQYI